MESTSSGDADSDSGLDADSDGELHEDLDELAAINQQYPDLLPAEIQIIGSKRKK